MVVKIAVATLIIFALWKFAWFIWVLPKAIKEIRNWVKNQKKQIKDTSPETGALIKMNDLCIFLLFYSLTMHSPSHFKQINKEWNKQKERKSTA